ncbi:MAG: hypothetical protein K2N46_03495 [Lachnospiraceae bacterium]|nr:hypothetical protein [Lachnospiraceae bacterium]
MLKLYIGRNAGRTVCLTLPASYEEVDKALAEFGDARPEAPVLIQEARTSVPYLEGRLKGLSFEERENRQELSFLARRIRYLTQTEQDVFSAALRMEEPGTLEEIINLSYNLDQYERIPPGTDQSELSRMMLKKDKGIEVPAEIAGFLDHERVSSAYFLRHKGEFSPSGLVLKKEGAVPEEVYGNGRHVHPGYEKGSLILLHLYQKGYRSPYGDYALSVPAPRERIALAREHFGVENLDGFGFYTSFVGREDLTDYLPAGLGAEEINRAATFFMEEVLDGTEERLQQLYAVLEAECPRTLEEALEAAGNLMDYRLCPEDVDSPQEYVHHILEDSEVYYLDGFIEQFVDMDRMAKALMEETGAVETSHGIVTSDKWRFRDLSGDLVTTRLFSPVQGEFFEEDDWGNMGETPSVLDGRDLMQYASAIQERINGEDWSHEGDRGLAVYLDNQLLKQRVVSMFPGIEEVNGCLYGTMTVVSRGGLLPQELGTVMESWSGQASDGWGEGFEQREFQEEGGILYVRFWQPEDSFEILPEDVFFNRIRQSSGPQMGGM